MSQRGLEQYGAYQKAQELFDLLIRDMEILKADPRCYRLITQQVASADSICANIEEGYGRQSRVEYVRFLGQHPPSPALYAGSRGTIKTIFPFREAPRHRPGGASHGTRFRTGDSGPI